MANESERRTRTRALLANEYPDRTAAQLDEMVEEVHARMIEAQDEMLKTHFDPLGTRRFHEMLLKPQPDQGEHVGALTSNDIASGRRFKIVK